MSFEELDPEVVADLQLRAATEHDSTRSRPTTLRFEPSVTVRLLPCRNGKCRKPCELTEDGQARIAQFNRILLARSDQPLNEHELLVCDECRALLESHKADRNREHRELMRKHVAALKNAADPFAKKGGTGEYVLADEWTYVEKRHPDPRGLAAWLRDQQRTRKQTKPNAKEKL